MLAMDINDNVPYLNDRVVRAFFASRLAPTVGLGTSGRDWLAVRPPSPAGWLPQGIGVHPSSSPLNRPSVSSPAALDLDPPAPSAG
ncbi:hypothetical protein D3C71_1585440 [compost metagenome]